MTKAALPEALQTAHTLIRKARAADVDQIAAWPPGRLAGVSVVIPLQRMAYDGFSARAGWVVLVAAV